MKIPLYLYITVSLLSVVAYADFPMSEPAATTSAQAAPTTGQTTAPALSPEQMDSLVAPIALYPDELVSQILVACTYPLEVVQAYQWIQQHPDLKGQDLTAAAQKETWDPSVQALVAFPDVLKRLNQDVTWTTNVGNAFLANQSAMMDEIQKMRSKAEDAGKLTSTPQQTVSQKEENGHKVVVIEPASADVVYVPDYDPVWIWGPAPAYYPYPYWYYPPAPPVGVWCWWGPRIYLGGIFVGWNGWGGWGWHPHWNSRTVIVNRTFIETNHFHPAHFSEVRGRTVWVHNPEHRIGVSYPTRALNTSFHATRPAVGRVSVPQAQAQFRAAGARFQAADRFGNRQVSPGVFNRNHTAFGGVEAGQAARAHSTRGNSSLNHTRSAGSAPAGHPASSGGGGRSWGGEGGGGHGGMGGGHR